jgi:hypothetical protein
MTVGQTVYKQIANRWHKATVIDLYEGDAARRVVKVKVEGYDPITGEPSSHVEDWTTRSIASQLPIFTTAQPAPTPVVATEEETESVFTPVAPEPVIEPVTEPASVKRSWFF